MNTCAVNGPGKRGARGFTLVEILVTFAIIATLGTLVIPSFRAVAANQALGGSAQELLSAVLTARSTALKTNQRVLVQPTDSTSWTSGWRVYVDADHSASYNAGSDTLVVTKNALPTDITVGSWSGGSGETAPTAVFAFNGDGYPANIAGVTAGSVMLKSGYTGNIRCVVLSRVGRPRIYAASASATNCVGG